VDATLVKALAALVPAGMLFWGALVGFLRAKTVSSALQIVGAGCAAGVVLTHVFEARHVFAWMEWGREQSVGHYVDLSCAVLAFTLFPIGYLLQALSRHPH
jgi:hypothetical protein